LVRVFISYATEQRSRAEGLHHRLSLDGHRVFWDQVDLSAGEGYDARIRAEIERCDVFVFLISKESIAGDSYARAELELARARWPRPNGQVVPVMADDVPIEQLPQYLRALTVPQVGDPSAVALAAIDKRARELRRRTRLQTLAAALALAIGALLVWRFRAQPEVVDGVALEAEILRAGAGVLSAGDSFELRARLHNTTAVPIRIEDFDCDFDDERFHFVSSGGGAPDVLELAPNESWSGTLRFRCGYPDEYRFLADHEVGAMRWRLGWTRLSAPQLSAWRAWAPQGTHSPAPARELSTDFAARVERLASAGGLFFVAVDDPPELLACDASGAIQRRAPLEAAPSCMTAAESLVVLGFAASASVAEYDSSTLELRWRERLPATRLIDGEADLATRPVSVAALAGEVWVSTYGDGAGGAVLVRTSADAWRLHNAVASTVVPAAAYTLRAIDDAVWGSSTGVVPSDLLRFSGDSAQFFSGHDELHDFASDARDVAPGFEAGSILLCRPSNELAVVSVRGSSLRLTHEYANPIADRTDLGRTWQEERILRRGAEAWVFHSSTSAQSESPLALRIVCFTPDSKTGALIVDAPLNELLDAAVSNSTLWFATRDDGGRVRLLSIP